MKKYEGQVRLIPVSSEESSLLLTPRLVGTTVVRLMRPILTRQSLPQALECKLSHTGTASDGKTFRMDKKVRCESRFPGICTTRLALTRVTSLRILGCVYCCAVYDLAGKVDLSKGCRDPKRNLAVTTRSSEKQ